MRKLRSRVIIASITKLTDHTNALRSWIIIFAVYREARKNLSNLQKPFLEKEKKNPTGNLVRDQVKRANFRTELSVQNYTLLNNI